MDKIGERIKQARVINKLTQSELAKKINKSSQVISNWERGYTSPNFQDVELLATILNVPSAYLLGVYKDILSTEPLKIGERIKFIRTKKKLTQSELAEKINKSAQAISNWERGAASPAGDDLVRLASALDVTTKYLFGVDSELIDISDGLLSQFSDETDLKGFPFISVTGPNYLTDVQFFEFFLFMIKSFPRTFEGMQSLVLEDINNFSFLTESMKKDLISYLKEFSSFLLIAPQLNKEEQDDRLEHITKQATGKLKKRFEDY